MLGSSCDWNTIAFGHHPGWCRKTPICFHCSMRLLARTTCEMSTIPLAIVASVFSQSSVDKSQVLMSTSEIDLPSRIIVTLQTSRSIDFNDEQDNLTTAGISRDHKSPSIVLGQETRFISHDSGGSDSSIRTGPWTFDLARSVTNLLNTITATVLSTIKPNVTTKKSRCFKGILREKKPRTTRDLRLSFPPMLKKYGH